MKVNSMTIRIKQITQGTIWANLTGLTKNTVEVLFKCIHLKCFFAADNDIGILDFLLNFKYLDPARTVKNFARWLVFGVGKLNFALEPLVREGLNVKKSDALNPH